MSSSCQFLEDIVSGLSRSPRKLPSKYFYNDRGSELFSQIMHLPDYYLTRAELEIVSTQAASFFDGLPLGKPLEIIELGAGDGTKVLQLLRFLEGKNHAYQYIPIDISQKALDSLSVFIKNSLPNALVHPHCGDYFEWLKQSKTSESSKLILFLGSNIGNFSKSEAISFLKSIRDLVNLSDRLIIGFDLIKHPKLIRDAYNDKAGLTKSFNLNLLERINQELEADFNIDNFDHYESYDPELREARSYLVSLKDQTIQLKKAKFTVDLHAYECIHVEISRKFSMSDIKEIAYASGFTLEKSLFDCKQYFTDCILTPYKSIL